jgi:hypothetical protein
MLWYLIFIHLNKLINYSKSKLKYIIIYNITKLVMTQFFLLVWPKIELFQAKYIRFVIKNIFI